MRFYEALLQDRPDFTQVLANLGDAYTRKGFYQEGLEVDKRLVRLKPEDSVVRYNLACSLSLVGDLDAALGELKRAILLGYDEFDYIVSDKDMDNLRETEQFKSFWRKIIKGELWKPS